MAIIHPRRGWKDCWSVPMTQLLCYQLALKNFLGWTKKKKKHAPISVGHDWKVKLIKHLQYHCYLLHVSRQGPSWEFGDPSKNIPVGQLSRNLECKMHKKHLNVMCSHDCKINKLILICEAYVSFVEASSNRRWLTTSWFLSFSACAVENLRSPFHHSANAGFLRLANAVVIF